MYQSMAELIEHPVESRIDHHAVVSPDGGHPSGWDREWFGFRKKIPVVLQVKASRVDDADGMRSQHLAATLQAELFV